MQLIAAICAAISAGCLALFLGRFLLTIDLSEKRENAPKRMPIIVRLLLPAITVTRPFAASSSLTVWRDMVAPRLWMAGLGEVFTPVDFIALRIAFLLVAFFLLILGLFAGYFWGFALLALLFALFPAMWLSSEIKRRHLSIMKALPNVLDLLTLSVESGRDLLSALRDILARRKLDPLGEELMRTFQEIQFGRKRADSLRALSQRVRQNDLTAAMNSIIQAEELGVSIAQILRIQSDMQRNKRFTLAEKLANEASVKIIMPIIICILPAVMLILIGPFALRVVTMFQ